MSDTIDSKQFIHQKNVRFGKVLKALEKGFLAKREGWNGKTMFVWLVQATVTPVENKAAMKNISGSNGEGVVFDVQSNAHFAIKNMDNSISTWVPSVNDCLAKDWVIFE